VRTNECTVLRVVVVSEAQERGTRCYAATDMHGIERRRSAKRKTEAQTAQRYIYEVAEKRMNKAGEGELLYFWLPSAYPSPAVWLVGGSCRTLSSPPPSINSSPPT
jgi:hypothetical protein